MTSRRPPARIVRVLLALAVTVLIAGIVAALAGEAGFRRPDVSLWINFFGLVWAVFLQRLLHLSFGAAYYRPRSWEMRIYERLGVRTVKRMLGSRFWRPFNTDFRFETRGVGMLDALEKALREAETGHVLAFGAMLAPFGYALARGWWDAAAWLLGFNVLLNGYPVMVQRYNRSRLERVRRGMPSRSAKKAAGSL